VAGLEGDVEGGAGGGVGEGRVEADLGEGLLVELVAQLVLAEVDAGAEGGVEVAEDLRAGGLGGGDADPDRSPACAISSTYCSGSSRPSLRTDRLITLNRTSSGRTFSTSRSQRDVSHAHGQSGSNHMSTVPRSVIGGSWEKGRAGLVRSLLVAVNNAHWTTAAAR
jgi:hypothetical protein